MTTPNPKCSRCRCYWIPDDTDIRSSGLNFSTCKKCRDKDAIRKEQNRERKQKYREQNREELRDKAKEYYKNNKEVKQEYLKVNRDRILARNKEEVVCECGITTTRDHSTEHKRSEKHKIFLEFKTKTDDDISKDLLTKYHRCVLCKIPINNKEWSLKHHYLKEHNKKYAGFNEGLVWIYASNEVKG